MACLFEFDEFPRLGFSSSLDRRSFEEENKSSGGSE